MKCKQTKFKIIIDPYESVLTVIVTDNVKEVSKQIMKVQEFESEATFIHEEPDNNKYIIIIDYKASPGTIAHEVAHLSFKLLNNCGVDIINNDEPNSYCIGFVVDKIWNKLIKLNKKENSKIERLVEKDDNNKNE